MLDIASYPFVPPSTLSGFLYRLWRYATSTTKSEGPDFLETGLRDSPFYYLPKPLISLGAYSERIKPVPHRTKRHGTKGFASKTRSALVTADMEAPQLHSWEYLLEEHFVGYVLCQEKEPLEALVAPFRSENETLPYGGKLGKEGYAYLEFVSPVLSFRSERGRAEPRTLITLEEAINGATQGELNFSVYTLYKPVWEGVGNWQDPAPIKGFEQFPMAFPEGGQMETDWWVAEGFRVPQSLVEVWS
ncbi:hypothetical protein Mlute_00675 [Meiothermus luteus]|jgi:hypothetical protein|uniref:CRISPR-associated protein Cas5 n=2 Tax=Meiothermus luteus TaxID=2026184 RepID=A0A399EZ03_9DEIN|nr:hypothetical protein Mlute_00675 [Meiothermus luteus]